MHCMYTKVCHTVVKMNELDMQQPKYISQNLLLSEKQLITER